MSKAVIEDWDQFNAYLAAKPFCKWAAQKRQEVSMRNQGGWGPSSIHSPPPKNDNADLAAALASMA